MTERSYKTNAIILRRSELGESDYLITAYTPTFGKVRAVAKGARKPASRQTGQVELYTLAHLVIHRGRELHVINQAQTQEPYLALHEDLERSIYASHFAELLDLFTYEDENTPAAFDLISAALAWLCEPESDIKLTARYYEFQLLRVMGYEPALFDCVVSGEELVATSQYFCVSEGGVVAAAHTAGLDVLPLSLAVFKILRHFSREKWQNVKTLRLETAHHAELERLLHSYLTYLLERQLKSADVLRKLKQALSAR